MYKTLVTGFEPYGNYDLNSSWVVAEKVATCVIDGVEIVIEQMPVSFSRVAYHLHNAVKRHNPNLIILLGQSAASDCIKLERTALNIMDSNSADNDGYIPDEEPIYKNETPAYFTNVPIKHLCSKIKEKGINVKVSNSCGLYVCNRTYYEALRICSQKTSTKAIFIHLPLYKGHSSIIYDKKAISLSDLTKAISIIIKEIYEKYK